MAGIEVDSQTALPLLGSDSSLFSNTCQRCPVCQEELWSAKSQWIHRWLHAEKFYYACQICNEKFDEFEDLKLHQQKHFADKAKTDSDKNRATDSTSPSSVHASQSEELVENETHSRGTTANEPCSTDIINCSPITTITKDRVETNGQGRGEDKEESEASSDECLIIDECLLEASKPKKKRNGSLEETRTEPCYKCDMLFSNQRSLQEHLRQTHNEKMFYPCVHCGKTFLRHSSLCTHIEIIHKIFTCPLCSQFFFNPTHFFEHQDNHRKMTMIETKTKLRNLQVSSSHANHPLPGYFARHLPQSHKTSSDISSLLPPSSYKISSKPSPLQSISTFPSTQESYIMNSVKPVTQSRVHNPKGNTFPNGNVPLMNSSSPQQDGKHEVAFPPRKDFSRPRHDEWLNAHPTMPSKRLTNANDPTSGTRKSSGSNVLKFHLNFQNQRKYQSYALQGEIDWHPRKHQNQAGGFGPSVPMRNDRSNSCQLPTAVYSGYNKGNSNVASPTPQVNFYLGPSHSNYMEEGRVNSFPLNQSGFFNSGPPLLQPPTHNWNSTNNSCSSVPLIPDCSSGATFEDTFDQDIFDTSCCSCQPTEHLKSYDINAARQQPSTCYNDWSGVNWQSAPDFCACTETTPKESIDVQIAEDPLRKVSLSYENNSPYFLHNYEGNSFTRALPKHQYKTKYYPRGISTSSPNTFPLKRASDTQSLYYTTPTPLQPFNSLNTPNSFDYRPRASIMPTQNGGNLKRLDSKIRVIAKMENLKPATRSEEKSLGSYFPAKQTSLQMQKPEMKRNLISRDNTVGRFIQNDTDSFHVKAENYVGTTSYEPLEKNSIRSYREEAIPKLDADSEEANNDKKLGGIVNDQNPRTDEDRLSKDKINSGTLSCPLSDGNHKKGTAIRCLTCCALFMSEIDAQLHDFCVPEETVQRKCGTPLENMNQCPDRRRNVDAYT